jgi:selenide,water dikinase
MPENVCTAPDVAGAALSDPAVQALLFDPQTAGGLLAGVPSSHLSECLAALAGCGEVASARIGAVLAAVGEGGVRIKLVGTLPHA